MAVILFPHQLFSEVLTPGTEIILVEHPLFFTQLPFHSQKLILHHVSMRVFRDLAEEQGCPCTILSLENLQQKSLQTLLTNLSLSEHHFFEPRDDYLSRELREIAKTLPATFHPTPSFLTSVDQWQSWCGTKKLVRMQSFYQWQRKRLGILVEGELPTGGMWSFDTENRKPIPKGVVSPPPFRATYTDTQKAYLKEATQRFSEATGSSEFSYPVSHSQASEALEYFVATKLTQFGDFEDAVRIEDPVLFHSQLSPLLNCGLLTPSQVLTYILEYSATTTIPLNSLEGFIRQLIGWREFMSLTYITHGRALRSSNVLNHHNPLPQKFWSGQVGLLPIDHTVKQVLATGYAHHIERLMILGVFMLLTETEPSECFNWFFSLFIDAYDWVMVPNVYSMSQYADGGLLTTKPYLCGSSYLRKMTNFPKGEWCDTWDALYWRWVSRHQDLLRKNPRTSMSVAMWNKWDPQKQQQHLARAEAFLQNYYA